MRYRMLSLLPIIQLKAQWIGGGLKCGTVDPCLELRPSRKLLVLKARPQWALLQSAQRFDILVGSTIEMARLPISHGYEATPDGPPKSSFAIKNHLDFLLGICL